MSRPGGRNHCILSVIRQPATGNRQPGNPATGNKRTTHSASREPAAGWQPEKEQGFRQPGTAIQQPRCRRGNRGCSAWDVQSATAVGTGAHLVSRTERFQAVVSWHSTCSDEEHGDENQYVSRSRSVAARYGPVRPSVSLHEATTPRRVRSSTPNAKGRSLDSIQCGGRVPSASATRLPESRGDRVRLVR
jgi:hypothetical protein